MVSSGTGPLGVPADLFSREGECNFGVMSPAVLPILVLTMVSSLLLAVFIIDTIASETGKTPIEILQHVVKLLLAELLLLVLGTQGCILATAFLVTVRITTCIVCVMSYVLSIHICLLGSDTIVQM